MRTIFEGQLAVSSSDYTHQDEEAGDAVDIEIDDLDTRVTSHAALSFTLDYPFEQPYHGEVRADGGATLRQVIDAIRTAYRELYRNTTVEPIPDLDNMRVRGPYGQALHVIDDLVIESIELDDETGRLEVCIGS